MVEEMIPIRSVALRQNWEEVEIPVGLGQRREFIPGKIETVLTIQTTGVEKTPDVIEFDGIRYVREEDAK